MRSINKQYSDVIKNNPLLTKKQEVDLANRIKKGDTLARKKLIESNFRLVISIAKKYHRSDVNFDDLLQESSIGLLKAVDRFDPDLGYKFSTYACWWIKQAALQYINENISDIKVPTHSRILNSKIKKVIDGFEEEKGTLPTHDEIANILGETSKKIKYTIKANKRLSSMDKEKSDSSFSLKDTIEDESLYSNPEKLLMSRELEKIVKESLSLLTSKEEKILRLRFGITEDINNVAKFPITKEMKKYLNEK
jgi:RNA polymerase primary sigma factor